MRILSTNSSRLATIPLIKRIYSIVTHKTVFRTSNFRKNIRIFCRVFGSDCIRIFSDLVMFIISQTWLLKIFLRAATLSDGLSHLLSALHLISKFWGIIIGIVGKLVEKPNRHIFLTEFRRNSGKIRNAFTILHKT